MRKSRLRIKGADRALMLLCRQARKFWRYYSPVYQEVKNKSYCESCKKTTSIEVDHNPRLGSRPRTIEELPNWWNRLMFGPQEGLCKKHHLEKTRSERKARKK